MQHLASSSYLSRRLAALWEVVGDKLDQTYLPWLTEYVLLLLLVFYLIYSTALWLGNANDRIEYH